MDKVTDRAGPLVDLLEERILDRPTFPRAQIKQYPRFRAVGGRFRCAIPLIANTHPRALEYNLLCLWWRPSIRSTVCTA